MDDVWTDFAKTTQEALEQASTIVVFVMADGSGYGPILAFERKLTEIEVKDLLKRKEKMWKVGKGGNKKA